MVSGQMLLHHRPSSLSLSSNKNHHVKMSPSSSSSSSSSDGDFGALKIKEGKIQVPRDDDDYTLHYTLVRPMSLSSRQAAPMVVLHGGPSVPANYLYPLAKHIPYRSILFYDQLGCGKSDEPTDISCYSIQKAVQDLELLLKKLSVRRFHLYGQSFGGILAFEYLKKKYADDNDDANDVERLSVILSSAPVSRTRSPQIDRRIREPRLVSKYPSMSNERRKTPTTLDRCLCLGGYRLER